VTGRRTTASGEKAASETARFLEEHRATIVAEAAAALARAEAAHYESAGTGAVQERLETLFDRVHDAVARRDLVDMIAYARRLAQERFDAGYDLWEIQAALNGLEEATWRCVLANLEREEPAEMLGLVSTILGAAKDALAREYVSLATHRHAGSLDLRALFAGIAGV
jgi:hypothetical protein